MRKSITLFDDQYAFYKELKSEKLLVAFVEYMFEDKSPEWLNSMEQVIWNSLLERMDNWKWRSDAWSKSHWWWRPKKQGEELPKNNIENNKKTTEKQQDKVEVEDISRSISNKIEEKETTNKQTMCDKSHDEYSFDLFWNKYPNKKDRKKAKDKFSKLSIEKRKQAIEWIDRLRNSDQWQRWFIPLPTTYLNWERWEDEVNDKNYWIEQLKERERQRIREEAQEILNHNKNENGKSIQTESYNRRTNFKSS